MLCPHYMASTVLLTLEFENDLKRSMGPVEQFCNTHTKTLNIGEIILTFKNELGGEYHWLERKRDKDPRILWNSHGRALRLIGLMSASR